MDWIAKGGAEFPSHPALVEVARGRVTSYAELHERASRLAAVLQGTCGVGAGDRVAALMGDRRELIEILLACRRTGAVFVPLDTRLPERKLGEILGDCRPAAVVHESRWEGVCAAGTSGGSAPRRIAIGPAAGRGALPYALALSGAGAFEPQRVAPDDVAMILYTFSASGRLRGAMLPWLQVELDADTLAERFAFSIDDRGLPLVPLSDTIGLNGLAMPLLRSGGTVVVLRDRDDAQALQTLGSQGVTTIVARPADYQRLMSAGLHHLPLERLRCLLVLGAPCPVSLIEAYRERGLRLRVGYGLTEVGPGCFSFGPADRPHSVGKPVPGSMARVTGPNGAEVGRGEVGELWLKGPHLSVGYWGQPEREGLGEGEDGWFRTGDRACRDEEGWYYVVDEGADHLRHERSRTAISGERV